ncbi:MAG: polysaccharide biosynthesis tyrosine autokinase [Pseudomonadales bacterium]|nr:polysaccharide biosynthesis tyrosine autokinase [Pseudomonadales bacterium]
MNVQKLDEQAQDSVDVEYYFRLLLVVISRYYVYIISFMLVCLGLAHYQVQSQIPAYTASLTLHLASKDGGYEDAYDGWGVQYFQTTQIGILSSQRLMKRVAEQLKLDLEFDTSPGSLQGALTVVPFTARDYSNLVNIEVTWVDAEVAAKIANLVAENYIQLMFDQEVEYVLRNQSFLAERLTLLKAELHQAEVRLQEYKEQQDILDPVSGQDQAGDEVKALSDRFYNANENRLKLEALYNQVEGLEGHINDYINIPAILDLPRIGRLHDAVMQLKLRLDELAKRYGPRHVKMVSLVSEYRSANEALLQQVATAIKGIEIDYRLAVKNVNSLSLALEAMRGEKQSLVRSLGRKGLQLKDLQQDVDTRREVYAVFLQRLNQADAIGAMKNTNIWVVDPAIVPQFSNAGMGNLIYLVAAMVSLLVGLGLGYGRELMRNVIVTDAEIEAELGIYCLGVVPFIVNDLNHKIPDETQRGVSMCATPLVDSSEVQRQNSTVTPISPLRTPVTIANNTVLSEYLDNSEAHFAESIRSIRTTLSLHAASQAAKRYMLTSTEPHEGKTSLALALSASFGQLKRVLLIDCDLRKPSLEKIISSSPQRLPGLADILAGTKKIDECLLQYQASNVSFLCAGSRTLSPLELLSSAGFGVLLNELAEKFDVLVIDTPPCLAVSDAYVIASQVDSVLFVVKSASTKIPVIRKVINRLNSLDINLAGALLNQVDFSSKFGYGYGYNAYKHYYRSYKEEPEDEQGAA